MRELRDPQNGCQIGQVPLYGIGFCKTPSIRVQLGLKQLGVVFNSYSNPRKVKVKRTLHYISIVITHHSQIFFIYKLYDNIQIYP